MQYNGLSNLKDLFVNELDGVTATMDHMEVCNDNAIHACDHFLFSTMTAATLLNAICCIGFEVFRKQKSTLSLSTRLPAVTLETQHMSLRPIQHAACLQLYRSHMAGLCIRFITSLFSLYPRTAESGDRRCAHQSLHGESRSDPPVDARYDIWVRDASPVSTWRISLRTARFLLILQCGRGFD